MSEPNTPELNDGMQDHIDDILAGTEEIWREVLAQNAVIVIPTDDDDYYDGFEADASQRARSMSPSPPTLAASPSTLREDSPSTLREDSPSTLRASPTPSTIIIGDGYWQDGDYPTFSSVTGMVFDEMQAQTMQHGLLAKFLLNLPYGKPSVFSTGYDIYVESEFNYTVDPKLGEVPLMAPHLVYYGIVELAGYEVPCEIYTRKYWSADATLEHWALNYSAAAVVVFQGSEYFIEHDFGDRGLYDNDPSWNETISALARLPYV